MLGTIASFCGFNIVRFIIYIREELLTVLGTSSSESALVPLMHKLERLGCSKSVVGLAPKPIDHIVHNVQYMVELRRSPRVAAGVSLP